jgi:hypothetical protein
MIEPILQALTQPIQMLALFSWEALLVSGERFLRVIRIELVFDVPGRFSDHFSELRVLIGDDRLHFSIWASATHRSGLRWFRKVLIHSRMLLVPRLMFFG